MKNVVTMEVRKFPLLLVKNDNQEAYSRHIVLTKEQLRAAQIVGESSKEVIIRLCTKQGYKVVNIGKPERKTLSLDLDALWLDSGWC